MTSSFVESMKKTLTEMGRLDELNAFLAKYEHQAGTYKEVYKQSIVTANPSFRLIPLADLHVGHKNFNIDKLLMFVNYILSNQDTYTIILGDAIETATRNSVGMGMFEESMHVEEQIELVCKILEPLVKAGKLWGVHIGNHEYRIPKEVGISPAEIIASRLGVPYLGYQGYNIIKTYNTTTGKELIYNMMSFHGTGGGSTIGSLVNSAERGDKVCLNADLYISGHTHIKNAHTKYAYIIDEETEQLIQVPRYYVICGSFIEYWNSYAEMKVLPPQATGAVVITFDTDEKKISIIS